MIPTPHIAAGKEDIASTVIMPGDPMRSEWIAKTFLSDARLVNNIRGVRGYTGRWHGKDVTVMASGMGIPSISIYAYELFNFYDVKTIIRTGTAGSIRKNVKVGDCIIADIAYTNSSFLDQLSLPADYLPAADKELFDSAEAAAASLITDAQIHTGPVLTQEIYYSSETDIVEKWAACGVLAFEMEAAALYANAAAAHKKALAVFTVSNNILTGEEMDPSLREHSLADMVNIALMGAFNE